MRSLYSIILMMFSVGLQAEEKIFPNVDTIEINSSLASIFLTASKQETAIRINFIKKDPDFFNQYCRIESSTENGTFKFKSHAIKNGQSSACAIEIHVFFPPQKTVAVSLGHGDVYANGEFNKVTAEIGAGNIFFVHKKQNEQNSNQEAKGFSTKTAILNIGSGNVQMDFDVLPEQNNILVEVGWGSISLSSYTVPKSGKIRFEQGSGDSKIYFPKGSLFNAIFSSAWGSMSSELPLSEKANFSVHASTGMGKMKIFEKKKH